MKNGKANCVGYAQYSAALLNAAFRYKWLSSSAWAAVGQVHLYGVNMHSIAMAIMPGGMKAIFKDHDFVEVRLENDAILIIDTSLQDLFGKSFTH